MANGQIGFPTSTGKPNGRAHKRNDAEQNALRAKFKTTPLEYLLAVVNDHNETPARKMEAAKVALPFLHPRLEMIEAAEPVTEVVLDFWQLSEEELETFASLLRKLIKTATPKPTSTEH